MHLLAGAGVAAFALFLLGFAATIVARPAAAERFLGGFAGSAGAHYGEQAARLAVGGSLVGFSPEMAHPEAVRLFGWIMVATTVGLLGVPWRWHQRFARRVIPPVVRRLTLFGVAVALLRVFVLYSAVAPGIAGAR